MKRKAIYAGTFDPLTLGHLDLAERAARVFDRVILAVATEPLKETLFTAEERLRMSRYSVAHIDNVEVDSFNGLLIDYAHSRGVSVLLRGLRAFSDFETEFQMALTNRKLAPEIETLFMMPNETYSYVSSSRVKELWRLGGDIRVFVPKAVHRFLSRRAR